MILIPATKPIRNSSLSHSLYSSLVNRSHSFFSNEFYWFEINFHANRV